VLGWYQGAGERGTGARPQPTPTAPQGMASHKALRQGI